MYVNKQLTVQKSEIHRNQQGIYYIEIIPAHYVVAIKDKRGKWSYSLKIWRWDINHLYPRDLMCASTERFTSHTAALIEGLVAYGKLNQGHA